MNKFPIIPASKRALSLRKPVYGVGVNDAWYMTTPVANGKRVQCPFHLKWYSMLQRCYDHKFHAKNPTYKECIVCDDWFVFSNFRKWMVDQDWKGKELDKDILVKDNKLYSPETCLFVSREINLLLNDNETTRGNWPRGVCYHKKNRKFMAACGINGGHKFLGYFSTPDEAHRAYVQFKEAHVHAIALDQVEPLRSALLNWKIKS